MGAGAFFFQLGTVPSVAFSCPPNIDAAAPTLCGSFACSVGTSVFGSFCWKKFRAFPGVASFGLSKREADIDPPHLEVAFDADELT